MDMLRRLINYRIIIVIIIINTLRRKLWTRNYCGTQHYRLNSGGYCVHRYFSSSSIVATDLFFCCISFLRSYAGHLILINFVTALRSKPHYCQYQRYMFDSLMLMAHKQSYVTVMLNKRRYSSEIAVFNMSTVILYNTFKTTTPLVEATVKSMKRCDTFCHFGDYRSLQ